MTQPYLFRHLPRYQEGLRIEDPRKHTTEEVLAQYLRISLKNAHRWSDDPDTRDDLAQEGMLGVLEAINAYDPAKSKNVANFHHLAVTLLRGRQWAYLEREHHSPYHAPGPYVSAHRYLRKLRHLVQHYQDGTEAEETIRRFDSPSFDAIAPKHIQDLARTFKRRIRRKYPYMDTYEEVICAVLAVEAAMTEHREHLSQEPFAPDMEQQVNARLELERIQDKVQALPDRHQQVFRHRILAQKTLYESGTEVGCSQMRVLQIERQLRDDDFEHITGTQKRHAADRDVILVLLNDPASYTQRQIAEKLGRSPSYVGERIKELRRESRWKP